MTYDIQINASEKTIEDILCDNMDKFLNIKFVTRQFKTDSGIIDIIARDEQNKNIYYIIELKKGEIDTHAYAQVHRYCLFMNSCFNKGKRIFIPLLIGDDLADEIIKNVYYFDNSYLTSSSIAKTFYSLYSFDIEEGIQFNYYNKEQLSYENNICDIDWYIANLECENDYLKHLLEIKGNQNELV